MAQLFTRRATTIFRVALTLGVLGVAATGALAYVWARSDAAWNVGQPAEQPIPVRHDLHSGTLGVDCRYCHSSVERAAHAGMPSAQTCMSCHSQVWTGASVLEPLRSSLALDQAIRWTSVHRLPDYAYFHHGAHVSKGVACETCHGRVDQMPKTVRVNTLSMGWCLDCHRDPVPKLRPPEAVTAMGWTPPEKEGEARTWAAHDPNAPADIRAFYRAAAPRLTSCNTCHR